MTENEIQPKLFQSRSKKYHDDEDRRLAYNRQIKECMLRNPFQCDICDHMARKSKHVRSNKHLKKLK